jgi:hypothetical protein
MRYRLPREIRLRRANVERKEGPPPIQHGHWHGRADKFDPECYDCTSSAHRTRTLLAGSPEAVQALWDLCHRTPLRQNIAERVVKIA